jgi:hypothetical protein
LANGLDCLRKKRKVLRQVRFSALSFPANRR